MTRLQLNQSYKTMADMDDCLPGEVSQFLEDVTETLPESINVPMDKESQLLKVSLDQIPCQTHISDI
jgi:hypothetical protein